MFFIKLLIAICVALPCFVHSLPDMTLEEKVGQLLMVHFTGECANEDAKTLIQKVHVGGFIYYNWSNGLHSPKQVVELSLGLKRLSEQSRLGIPLFIAVDQEGGVVARLTKGFTLFSGNKALAMTGNEELSKQCAYAIGKELRAVGVNFNLSPVVDVNSNPRNPIIGIRAFGDSVGVVIPFAQKAIQGYHQAGIIVSLKHFPGHGDVEVDSHFDLPVIKKSKQSLQEVELLPFSKLAVHSDTVMTAHVVVPSLDPDNCATLSKNILDILRKEMGFKGVIISDSLVMGGLLKNCGSVDEAAIRAFNAGCDVILLGGKQIMESQKDFELTVADVERIHQSMVDAVRKGVISEARLNEAVHRILSLKHKYDLTIKDVKEEDLVLVINTEEHQELAKKIATLALRVAENKSLSLPLQQCRVAVFSPGLLQESINQTSLLKLGAENHALFFKGLNPTEEEIQRAMEAAKQADVLIVCSYNAWKNTSQVALMQALSQHKKPIICLALRDPQDATLFPEADLIITTFSPAVPSIQAACNYLYLKYFSYSLL